MKQVVSGRCGLKRAEARLPPIAPMAPHVETMPQSRGPPRWLWKTTGPSTRNEAKQMFEIAKPIIGARTQVRELTSLQPSRSSR